MNRPVAFFVLIVCLLMGFSALPAAAGEVFPFEIDLVAVDIPAMPGLHSFAFAQHEGVWVLIGGRLDGLHARQPNRSFPPSSNNTDVYVVDVASRQVWSSSVLDLPQSIAEQLQSTNICFYQDGRTLYLVGGYGYSPTARDHSTFPFLTEVDVPRLIDAVRDGRAIAPHARQISDPVFAVTGGQLGKIGSDLYLVGGHRFDGRYNPMEMPTFRQQYTNQIRVFAVDSAVSELRVEQVRTFTDPEHLRRRDYNLVPQLFPDGSEGYMVSSGVFREDADLPFLYPVDIRADGYTPIRSFSQLLSHYHSPKLPLYDAATGEMHAVFFGGMAQYYYRDGALVRDDLVPFVDTVSRLTRSPDGSLTEYLLPISMPGLLGAGAELIIRADLLRPDTKVVRAEDLGPGTTVVGYIVGGIRSPLRNPFNMNRTDQTSADPTVFELRVTRAAVAHRAVEAP